MDESTLKCLLRRLCEYVNFLEITVDNNEQFSSLVQCKLLGEDTMDEKCDNWVKDFSYSTNTNWITLRRYPNASRYEFRKLYVCQHSSVNKVAIRKRQSCKNRNKSCKAQIDFKFKKINRNTIKNDVLLKNGINVVIKIKFEHSHKVNVAEAFGYLRVNKTVQDIFELYFASGMTPSAARIYHEMKIIESDTEGIQVEQNVNTAYLLANARENPTERQIKHLYDKWRFSQYGSREEKTMLEVLKNRQPSLEKSGGKLVIKENPFIAVVVTPIMRRAFLQDLSNEMVFVDSSGSCDQTNTCITFVFTSNKTGAIPIACVLHTAQTEANYTLAFATAKEAIDIENKKFDPKVFMTDDSASERNALSAVFPNSMLLLCTFHLCQALWRWLWQTDHNIKKEDRRTAMEMFRNILYASTVEESQEHYDFLIRNIIVQGNKVLHDHLEKLWARRKEWCISYRNNIITRGNNTNNYTEASIRIFKDIVLQRCKVFNSCALVDFIVNVFENYYKRKLLEFANSRRSKPQIDYKNMCIRAKEVNIIYQIDNTIFHVASEKDPNLLYTVNAKIAFCDCPSGTGGKFCKHLCAVEQKFGILFKTSPVLTVHDRIQLAKLAVGYSAPEEFYKNMDSNVTDLENSVLSSNAVTAETSSVAEVELATVVDLQVNAEESKSRFKEEMIKMRCEFSRITSTLEANQSPEATLSIIKFNAILNKIKTPSQILNFLEAKSQICGRKSRKIRVQPTSISRRKNKALPQSGRIQAGRPSKIEKLKRKHSLGNNISQNLPNAKLH